ncbi:MAG: response regulator transcription factor [Dehalococcoidia bacterium]|jgi:two-component system OmpR family response regulator
MKGTTLLVVEDDNTLREVLSYNLRKEGYNVLEAADGGKAIELFRTGGPSLVILDLMLPVMSGLEVCRIIQSERRTPIIMLTAKAEEVDRVVGLEMGADDYVTKPFSMRELLARVKAVLRRAVTETKEHVKEGKETERYLQGGDIRIDLSRHSVLRGQETVELNPKEFELLSFLMSNTGQVIGREQVLRKVWGYDYIGNARTVDVHMRWLRQKLEAEPDKPVHLMTVRGYGYKFEP